MASSDISGSIDTLLMTVVSMGFELDDCQQAVQMGKLSTEEIIDWILSGKPAASPGETTLRLGPPRQSPQQSIGVIGSNPFSNPEPVNVDLQEHTNSSYNTGSSEELVKSRVIVSEEQRGLKQKFEEKQRAEAQKLAREERLAKKKEKEDVLKRIKEDRESAKVKYAKTAEKSPDPKENRLGRESAQQDKSSSQTMIQIRLPNGRGIREKFPCETTLQAVLDHVTTNMKINIENTQLVQPFPRVVYETSDMARTLAELSLTPSGSLVLNRIQPPPAQGPPPATCSEGAAATASDDAAPGDVSPAAVSDDFLAMRSCPSSGSIKTDKPHVVQPTDHQPATLPYPVPPPLPGHGQVGGQPGGQHQWGQGHVLMDTTAESIVETAGVVEEDMHVDEHAYDGDDVSDDASGHGDVDDQQQQQHHNYIAQAHAGNVTWHHEWGGGGQSLIGPVLNADMLPHRRKDPKQLAAEAASRRIVSAADECVAMDTEPSPGATVEVGRLVTIAMRHVCNRMSDPRQPVFGLQGIPHELAIKILQYLISEKLLNPKTLRLFRSCHLRSLVLDCYPYTTNELLLAIRLHPYLLHLSLASCPLITDRGVQELKSLKRLKVLNLSRCKQITNKVFQTFENLTSLVTLVLEDTGINDVGVTQYVQTSPANLHTLDLSRTAVTHHILQALPAIPNLSVLNLEGTQINSLSGIERLRTLECLNISSTGIVTDSLLLLGRCAGLMALNISNTPHVHGDLALQYISGLKLKYLQLPSRLSTTDAGMKYIAGMPLIELDLTNYINVGDAGVEHLGQMQSLKRLRLGNTKVTDAGLVFLPGLQDLEELLLDRTQVTDEGVSLVSGFSRLIELSVSETCITDAWLEKKHLNGCSALSKLNLSKTAISDKGIQCLALSNLNQLNIDRTFVSQDIASSLIDSHLLPDLQSVIYRQRQSLPIDMQEDQ